MSSKIAGIALAVSLLVLAAIMVPKLDDLVLRAMLYPVPRVAVGAPPPGVVELELEPAGGVEATAWLRRGPPERPALLYLHGNGENLETLRRAGVLDELEALEVTYLALDYPGYGKSGGRPSEAGLVAAAAAGCERLAEERPGSPLILFGWSLGAAVAVRAAADRADVAGLVVASPWDSLSSLGEVHFPAWLVRWAAAGRYDSLAAAPRVSCPVLWLHGRDDRIIPAAHGRRLAAAFRGPVTAVELAAGHNDLLASPRAWREVAAFAGRIAGRREAPPEAGDG